MATLSRCSEKALLVRTNLVMSWTIAVSSKSHWLKSENFVIFPFRSHELEEHYNEAPLTEPAWQLISTSSEDITKVQQMESIQRIDFLQLAATKWLWKNLFYPDVDSPINIPTSPQHQLDILPVQVIRLI